MKMYWVETADRAEDWFVVGRSKRGAARWHEKAEGYASGDAVATLVVSPAISKRRKAGLLMSSSKHAELGFVGANHLKS